MAVRRGPEQQHRVRPHQLHLAAQVGDAGRDLVGVRHAVAGGAALDDVRDQQVPLRVEADRAEQFVEHAPRAADKGPSREVLLLAGSLADGHDPRGRVAAVDDDVRPRGGEGAAPAPRFAQQRGEGGVIRGGKGVVRRGGEACRSQLSWRHQTTSPAAGQPSSACGLRGPVAADLHRLASLRRWRPPLRATPSPSTCSEGTGINLPVQRLLNRPGPVRTPSPPAAPGSAAAGPRCRCRG